MSLFTLFWGAHATFGAAVATFQYGTTEPLRDYVYTNVQDTYVLLNAGVGEADQNYGMQDDLEVGEAVTMVTSPRHTLIRFDVTSLSGQFLAISNITLRLAVTFPNEAGAGDLIQVFRLTPANANWVEGTETGTGGAPDLGMSTWAQRIQGSANWAGSAGASTPGVDYYATPIATYSYSGNTVDVGTYITLTFTDTSFFSNWVAGNNPGLLLRTASENNSRLIFASSQSATVAWRPSLRVEYAPTAPATNLLSIRVSEVELCWQSESNVLYQVQYRSDLTTNLWTDLGSPLLGTGLPLCTNDAVVVGEPKRFYRYVILP